MHLMVGCVGTQNAGLAFSGQSRLACTEEYDGIAWIVGGGMVLGRHFIASAGVQNAGLAYGWI